MTPVFVYDSMLWIRPINDYVEQVRSSSMFACRRYG
jgi:hypothetical protein